MKISDLKINSKNPRRISKAQKDALQASLKLYGDMGGIVFNARRGVLVGGNQRSTVLPRNAEIVIEHEYVPETATGTIKEGYVLANGERFKYREVNWSEEHEMAALIAANQHGGEWDTEELTKEINQLFKKNHNLTTLGFSQDELDHMISQAATAAQHAVKSTTLDFATPAESVEDVFRRAEISRGEVSDMTPEDPTVQMEEQALQEVKSDVFGSVNEETEIKGKRHLIIIDCPSNDSKVALKEKLKADVIDAFGAKIF